MQDKEKNKSPKIIAFGKEKTITEWSKITGLTYSTIYLRLNKKKMDPEEALVIPMSLCGSEMKYGPTARQLIARCERAK